jgi:hypothetical protein
VGEAHTIRWGGIDELAAALSEGHAHAGKRQHFEGPVRVSFAMVLAFSRHLRVAAAIHARGSAAVPPPMPCCNVVLIVVGLSCDGTTMLLPELFDQAGQTGRFVECRLRSAVCLAHHHTLPSFLLMGSATSHSACHSVGG